MKKARLWGVFLILAAGCSALKAVATPRFEIHAPATDGVPAIAARELADFCEKMLGVRPPVTTRLGAGNAIVLGSEAENAALAQLVLDKKIAMPACRVGSDDYYLRSVRESGRTLLLLGGGRPRALLYAVYDFLESCGCSFFWDGDVVPKRMELDLAGHDAVKSPRFAYRGVRYFAHRGLHRFQAEHWTLDDWKKEIDWILKKRLNLFMLRLGMDDVFQKAFPDVVAYPEDVEKGLEPSAEFDDYNDRTPFWPLRTRGRLRKDVLAYAFARDLMHPEDMGTMTHWYSQTPKDFLDRMKPPFIPQAEGFAGHDRVWDIRRDEWLERYFDLTEAHVAAYGKPEIFHTIGLAERGISTDPRVNQLWRLFAYRRMIDRLRRSYPNAPLLLASWTFYFEKWTPEEMRELVASLDADNTLIFDYTTDSTSAKHNFLNWGVVGKFPYIAGIFQCLQPDNQLRGNYDAIRTRLEIAAGDAMCKGLVLWPENAHGDVLMQEFFAHNAWRPDALDIHAFLPRFCAKRYPQDIARMHRVWETFLPVVTAGRWESAANPYAGLAFARLNAYWKTPAATPEAREEVARQDARLKASLAACAESFASMAGTDLENPTVRRDVIDMARTGAARLYQWLFIRLATRAFGEPSRRDAALDLMREIARTLADVLCVDPDYSLNASFARLRAGGPVNPAFETTLKRNTDNSYCRSFIAEFFPALYLPEFEEWAAFVQTGKSPEAEMKRIRQRFHATPLKFWKIDCEAARKRLVPNLLALRDLARRVAALAE